MYLNLKAELARKNLRFVDVAKELGIHTNSLRDKIQGKRSFTIEEALFLRTKYFDGFIDIDYLFARSSEG